jgi:purine-binding chemotaxis protein CheW
MSQPQSAVSSQYLSFILAGEEYALGILQVKEILEYTPVTRIPGAPPWVRGVFNLRGSVVPVVDLAVKLGLGSSTPGRWSCVVVVEVRLGEERLVLGVLADAIGQVMELGPGEVEPPPAFGMPVASECLVGLGRSSNKKFVLLLDLERVLSSHEVLQAGALRPPVAAPASEAAK